MLIRVLIRWNAPWDVRSALASIRKQLEALRIGAGEGYEVMLVEISPPPKRRGWWARFLARWDRLEDDVDARQRAKKWWE